ncbi:MAG TPA: MFS transporter, partial [Tahibacter sp.]|nr:MFS transporter [Tahibacter sp.]
VALTAWAHVPAAVGVAGWTLAGFGMGLAYPAIAVLALDFSTPGEEGVASSALQLSEALTVATVLALGGSLFATLIARSPTLAFVASYAVGIVLAGVGAVVAGRCRR